MPTLMWAVSPKATSYGVQVSTTPSFTTFIVNVIGVSTTSYKIPFGRLLGNTRYFWRVTAANSFGTSNYSAVANFVTEAQLPLALSPMIRGIFDVPNDNGKQVFVRWTVEKPAALNEIAKFSVWRRDAPAEWTFVTDIPALNDTLYRVVAQTVFDSTKVKGMAWSIFRVTAHSATPARYSMSLPDSGYSLDNLVPAVPGGLNGTTNGVNLIVLNWRSVPDKDLQYYKVYRDVVAGFTVDESKLIKKVADTTFNDNSVVAGNRYYYRIVAVDYSGNESAPSVEFSMKVTSVMEQSALPADYALEQNYPNPFNPATKISFALPSQSFVSLKVFDALGKEAALLVYKELPAGTYVRQWNAAGLPSGVYFYRLQAGSFTETKKLILLR